MWHGHGQVVGDVFGKGIAAAMLVAVLVGTIRPCVEESFDPAAICARSIACIRRQRLHGRARTDRESASVLVTSPA